MTWLLTGGAGYIGAHIVRELQNIGRKVVVVDDLSAGFPDNVPEGVPLVRSNVLDTEALERTMREHHVVGVIHLAAKKAVGESVERPLWYYEQNVTAMCHLLEAMERSGVKQLVFSSSAATYGDVQVETVTEETLTQPTSPYGETKLIGEWLMKDQSRAVGMSYVSLRYFNVAGAGAPELGDRSVSNLIPLVFGAVSNGRRPQVFGADWPTRDGSCIRDYIHVVDLARAHAAAVVKLEANAATNTVLGRTYNIGTGDGTTVLEVVEVAREVTGLEFEPEIVARRPGDPARIVADPSAAERELSWRAELSLRDMVSSAWASWQHMHRLKS
jgi:UDP-glucose 4-epimerase